MTRNKTTKQLSTSTPVKTHSGTTWENIVLGSKTQNCCLLCGGLITSARKTLPLDVIDDVLKTLDKQKISQCSVVTRFTKNIVNSAYAVDPKYTQEKTVNFYACACCHYWFERRRKRQNVFLPLVLLHWYINTIHVDPAIKFKVTKNRSFDMRVCKRLCVELCKKHGKNQFQNIYWNAFTQEEQCLIARFSQTPVHKMMQAHVTWIRDINNHTRFFHSAKLAEIVRSFVRNGNAVDPDTPETDEIL